MGNTFIAVEGTQDVELVAGLLEAEGFAKVAMLAALDESIRRQVSTEYPYQGDLYKRVPNPLFMQRDSDWVAIRAANGDAPQLAATVRRTMRELQVFPDTLVAIGVICDTDDEQPADRFQSLLVAMSELRTVPSYSLEFPEKPGDIAGGKPRFGIYLLPDNLSCGSSNFKARVANSTW